MPLAGQLKEPEGASRDPSVPDDLAHAPFLRRQLSHFWSFGASRGHFPSLAGAPLRFIGAKRPSLREGYLPAAQLPTQGTTEMRGDSWL